MQMAVSTEWAQTRKALANAVLRVTDMLKAVPDPNVPALGQWSAGDLAMHLSQVWLVIPSLARQDLSAIRQLVHGTAVSSEALIRDLWDLGGLTMEGVAADPERNMSVLADRIAARAAEFLQETEHADPTGDRPWLTDGTVVPLGLLGGHLLNESLVHGYDIARATGQRWKIDRQEATMILDRFLMPVVRRLPPRAMVDQDRAGGVRATFDLRIRGGNRYYFVFDDGTLRLEDPSPRKVDCHLSADPVGLLFVAWNRKSQWPAIAKGQLIAWGRKPWLGLKLRSFMRNP